MEKTITMTLSEFEELKALEKQKYEWDKKIDELMKRLDNGEFLRKEELNAYYDGVNGANYYRNSTILSEEELSDMLNEKEINDRNRTINRLRKKIEKLQDEVNTLRVRCKRFKWFR